MISKVGPPDQWVGTRDGDHVDRVYTAAGFGHAFTHGANPAVVVVDFTYGFTDPTAPTGSDMSDEIDATAEVVAVARLCGAPIFFTAIAYDNPGHPVTWLSKAPGMAALTAGSRAVQIDDRLEQRPEDTVIVKQHPSAFFGTGLASHLVSSGVDTVILCGATTSGCVRATAVDAVSYGFPVLVVREGVADRADGPHRAALFDLQAKYADVLSAREVSDYLTHLAVRPTT
ncbi:isochorismatase family protein [Rhodococcus sp. UFZ-B548]|uniref:isochorismatase family protein n=1 Tax=Rhodococcus sp. UFZ-B548 TaxID=2742212 RepID=UPI0015F5C48C|nr:isochorismatase family protein [Rhodococcus sp. UFZ-B548]